MNEPLRPAPDFVASSSMSAHTLPEGTRLRDFEIRGLIGEGGFGIVYLAYDHSLGRRVAIKEYLPASMASRAHASSAVVVKSQRHEETFRLGLKSFVNEARLLARFDHPALVKVYRFWEENGTAYMVMPYYEGRTLKAVLDDLGRPPGEAELRDWLRPLLDALAVMHAARCFHRDIAPDNILLTPGGPLLLDFGAARHVIGDMTHALTVLLKPGYAPIEQYGEVPSLTQGAWTDLYALASVVYGAIAGKAPISAVERLMDDRHVPLAQLPQAADGAFSENFVLAIDAALQLRPKDRPQDVAAFRLLLDGHPGEEPRSPLDFVSTFGSLLEPSLDSAHPITQPDPPPPHEWTVPQEAPHPQRPIAEPIAPSAPARGNVPADDLSRRWPLAVAALLGAAALAGVGGYLTRSDAPAPAPAAAAQPPATAPETSPAPSPRPAPAPASSAESTPPPTSIAAPPPAAPIDTRPPAVVADVPAPAPVATTPKPAPAPAAKAPTIERASPKNAAQTRAKCSDILQKASLEPLTASEAAFLRRECQ